MPQVRVPPPYQGPTQGNGRIDVEGATVLACLEAVGAKYPGFLEQVLDSNGATHRFVQLFVNGEEIDRSALATPVEASDTVEILAAIAGG
jgi:molybdopterin converting factor small subunit